MIAADAWPALAGRGHFFLACRDWILSFSIFFRRLGNLVAGFLGIRRSFFAIVSSLSIRAARSIFILPTGTPCRMARSLFAWHDPRSAIQFTATPAPLSPTNPKGLPMARTKGTKGENATPTGERENTSAYFRRIFKENPKLLKKDTNPQLYERWLKDHPGEKEVPKNVQAILHNLKSVLRKKRRQRRAEKDQPALVRVEASSLAPSTLAAPRRAGKDLAHLEALIDDCLAVAREMGREELAPVIKLLRSARNEVVLQVGV